MVVPRAHIGGLPLEEAVMPLLVGGTALGAALHMSVRRCLDRVRRRR